ncbi:MAG: putative LPS assembly protein LptD [Vicinamibacterales bacterium]
MVFFADPRHLPAGLSPVVNLSALRPPFLLALFALCCVFFTPSLSRAQSISGCNKERAEHGRLELIDPSHQRLTGTVERPVQIECDDMQLFADTVDLYRKEGRVTAEGHVTFVSGANRIAAERMEFDTRTKMGTFYVASGTSVMRPGTPGETAGGQEPYAYFWGDELHKIGPKKYRIVRGGFTACVQPTPRWEVSSGTLTLEVDDHVLLKNAVFRVKGVPLLYMPIFYYPMQEDDRSTGFVMPTYGTGTIAGQKISNAFFWAIGRSHDATFVHDWFTKTGQGIGAEYRYQLGGGSAGSARFYRLSEKAVTTTVNGVQTTTAGEQSYKLNGGLSQALPGGLHLRADADYFSSLRTQQRYEQNVYQATNRRRGFGANITGNWSEYVLSGTVDQRDTFDTATRLVRYGSRPRVTISKGERAVGKSPIYLGANADYSTSVRKTVDNDVTLEDRGLTRYDVSPTIRIPFTKLPYFTVNSSASWRGTYWNESLDVAAPHAQIEAGLGRSFFAAESRVTGPVFNRIFNTEGNGYADKFKHVVEPTFTIRRTTAIEQFDRIVKLDSTDTIVGGVTELAWGLSNRLYAKKGASREIANLEIRQSYYTDESAAQFDQNFQSSYNAGTSKFTPVAILARVAPTTRVQGSIRTEWDASVKAIRTIAASGSFTGRFIDGSASWSQRRVIPELPSFSEGSASHYVRSSTNVHTSRNHLGSTFSLDYDLKNDRFLQRRLMAYYNAQCCGVSVEWQTFNLQGSTAGVPQDRRFNISFTLAGIGAVPNFFGALSGQQDHR